MAISDTTSAAAARFSALPVAKQIGLLIGLAASIAIGVMVVLWSQDPVYRPLFSQLSSRDASEVIDVLARNGIEYKLNNDTGTILVTSNRIHDARMKLATEGLPKGSGRGFEMFDNASSFTTSHFMETARYLHALETELSRTIMKFDNVKAARVHLAIPRQSAFVRNAKKPSASIFVDIYPGFELSKGSVSSIVNLVASSVSSLTTSQVTLVDQSGQLLNEGGGISAMGMTDKYFSYQQQLEKEYAQKIKEILTPILGVGRIKAKVSADLDFTSSAQTREFFNPDMPSLRSEQSTRVTSQSGPESGGVAGAVSNQPPVNGGTGGRAVTTNESTAGSKDTKVSFTKNFELDKTISHTKQQPGRIKRLTVAVLVDDKVTYDEAGKAESKALSKEDIQKIRTLVADAVGLNTKRGDSLNVINSSFAKPQPLEAIPPLSLWEKAWFWPLVKQILGGIFILILTFGVIKPILNSLAAQAKRAATENSLQLEDGTVKSGGAPSAQMPHERLEVVKELASNDPKGVAQVVKTWVDGG